MRKKHPADAAHEAAFTRTVPGLMERLRHNFRKFCRGADKPDASPVYGGIQRVENPEGASDFVVLTSIDARTGQETPLALVPPLPPRRK